MSPSVSCWAALRVGGVVVNLGPMPDLTEEEAAALLRRRRPREGQ